MGKTRDLFKKIRDIKGIFSAKMYKKKKKKDRDCKNLTEEGKNERWQEYIEKL